MNTGTSEKKGCRTANVDSTGDNILDHIELADFDQVCFFCVPATKTLAQTSSVENNNTASPISSAKESPKSKKYTATNEIAAEKENGLELAKVKSKHLRSWEIL